MWQVFCLKFYILQFGIFVIFLSSFCTDIPLLPSISSLNAVDDDEPGSLFTVHWLNNKELQFTLAMEVFLEQLRGSLEQRNDCSVEGTEKCLVSTSINSERAFNNFWYFLSNIRFRHVVMFWFVLIFRD